MADNRSMTGQAKQQRPILAMGRGRVVIFATLAASILPLTVLHRYGDARLTHWAEVELGTNAAAFWRAVATIGQPLNWFVAAVVGFGVAAAYNWSNAARWTGMLLLAVLWAGLADIAVTGTTSGAATPAAVATVLCLWFVRWWPAWVGLAILACAAKAVAERTTGTQVALGALLGSVGVFLIEYAWHHAAPESPPRRNAPLRS